MTIRRNLGSPAEDPEVQSALSRKHSHGRWTVPLSNGKIAVFTHPLGSLLVAICDTWQEAMEVHVPEFRPQPRDPKPKPAPMSLDSFADLIRSRQP